MVNAKILYDMHEPHNLPQSDSNSQVNTVLMHRSQQTVSVGYYALHKTVQKPVTTNILPKLHASFGLSSYGFMPYKPLLTGLGSYHMP